MMLCVKSLLILNPWIVPRWPWRVAKGALKAPPPPLSSPRAPMKLNLRALREGTMDNGTKVFFNVIGRFFRFSPKKKLKKGKKLFRIGQKNKFLHRIYRAKISLISFLFPTCTEENTIVWIVDTPELVKS